MTRDGLVRLAGASSSTRTHAFHYLGNTPNKADVNQCLDKFSIERCPQIESTWCEYLL